MDLTPYNNVSSALCNKIIIDLKLFKLYFIIFINSALLLDVNTNNTGVLESRVEHAFVFKTHVKHVNSTHGQYILSKCPGKIHPGGFPGQ